MTSLILGIVPAREGSKEIPAKNLRLLAGRPLLAYTADAARAAGCLDRVILTTDSQEIAALGRSLGLETPFLRPPELAEDETPMQPVVEHAVAELELAGWSPGIVVLLQPTAPLRRGSHIREAVDLLRRTSCESVVSVVRIPLHFSPGYAVRLENGRVRPYVVGGARATRRQDVEAAYSRDGTVYAVRRDTLMCEHDLYGDDCRPLVIDRSESVNLDSPEDWAEAEARLSSSIARGRA